MLHFKSDTRSTLGQAACSSACSTFSGECALRSECVACASISLSVESNAETAARHGEALVLLDANPNSPECDERSDIKQVEEAASRLLLRLLPMLPPLRD